MDAVEYLDVDGSRVGLKQFEYVLYLYENHGLRNLSLVRYLKYDGFTEREALNLSIALNKWIG